MAIDWGAFEGSGLAMRVGIDTNWDNVNHGDNGANCTVRFFTENRFSWSDDQSISEGGAVSGSASFHNGGADGSQALRDTRNFHYDYGNREYGDSPGSRTFSCTLHGAFNGITPSKSVTVKIPARPIGAPTSPNFASVNRINDSSSKVTWTNRDTAGEPYSWVNVERKTYAYAGNSFDGKDWDLMAHVDGWSYTDSNITENRKYTYRVSATNPAGDSGNFTMNDIWTTPAAPTGCTRTVSGANQVISWVNNVNYSEYLTEVWHAANGVWDTSPLISAATGFTSYTHVAPSASVQHSYRVRARNSIPNLYSDYSNTTSATAGTVSAPSAPTNLSPTSSQVFDPTLPIVLSWRHNPTDGSGQTSFIVQHRVTGAGSWTIMARQFQASSNYTLAANTYTTGQSVDWQVQTWGSSGTASAFSASATFLTQPAIPVKYPVYLDLTSGRLEASSTSTAVTTVHMRRTTAAGQSIPDATITAVGFETAQDNQGGLTYTTGTKQWTIPVDGIYLLACGFQFGGATPGSANRRDAAIQLNGVTIAQETIHIGDNASIGPAISTTKLLSVGDLVTFCAYVTGGARSLNAASNVNWGSITQIA